MSFGLKLFDSAGNLTIDSNSKLPKYFCSMSGAKAYSANEKPIIFDVTVPGVNVNNFLVTISATCSATMPATYGAPDYEVQLPLISGSAKAIISGVNTVTVSWSPYPVGDVNSYRVVLNYALKIFTY